MKRHPLLSLVLVAPVVPMAIVAQVPDVAGETTPGWVAVFLLGAWVMHSVLDRAGKLPWGPPRDSLPQLTVIEAEKLREILADPSKVDQIHQIVTREDTERPGYYMVWTTDRERRMLQRKLDEHTRLVTATITTLEAIQRSLASLHNKMDELQRRHGP